MKTKNYMVSLKDAKTGETISETFIQSIKRNQPDFMLRDLYEKWSPEYKRKPYRDNIELKFSTRTEEDLKKLISLFGNKVNFGVLHFHLGQDEALYICYPPRIKTPEEAKDIIKRWFLATYFQTRTGLDISLLESLGNYILMSQRNPISLFEECTDWVADQYNIEILVQEVDEIPEESKLFGACGMKKENQDKLKKWKEEIQEYKEFELFFSIVDFNEKLLAYSQDYYDGKLEISLEEFNEERSCYLAMQKACISMLVKFGVDPGSFLDRENGSYWKWYNFWKKWMESFSDEAWEGFQSRLKKKESVDVYLPYGKWDK